MSKINIEDFRKYKICTKGLRKFCMRHNIDWATLIKDGIDHQVFINTGDGFAFRVINEIKERKKNRG